LIEKKSFLETDLVEVNADNAFLGVGIVVSDSGRDRYYRYKVFLFEGQYESWFAAWELSHLF
jgi:hypothetical protein